ncbi:MAG: FKBP-type peptidyl-prolyl cis-trans isomerase, partial [Smithellaceae bacterium]
KEFDSSVKRGQPVEFPLGQVIPCWSEGIGMMKVGGKARIACPSDLAYGDNGRPPIIPGGATLIFDVELLEVKVGAASNFPVPAAPAPRQGAKKEDKSTQQ